MIYSRGYRNIILKITVFLLFLTIFSSIFSQTIIHGVARSYTGDVLKIYKYTDNIIYSTVLLDTAKVDNIGEFSFSLNIKETQKVFIDLPNVQTFIYAEPDKNYEIRIPTKHILSDFELADPYFEKDNISAYVISSDKYELNKLINTFDMFIKYSLQHITSIQNLADKYAFLDTIKIISDTFALSLDNQYFNDYKKYSFAILKFVTVQGDTQFYIDSFFSKTPILYNLPPYFELFNYIFSNFFERTNTLIDIQPIYKGLFDNNFQKIKQQLIDDTLISINNNLAELIAVKGLYDKFYKIERAQNDVIYTFQGVNDGDVTPYTYLLLQNIYHELTCLRKDFPTYNFSLKNKRGKEKELSDFRGNFVYLNFIYPAAGRGLQHLSLLKKYQDAHIKDLEIVTIFVGDSIQEMKKFLTDNPSYKWTFFYASTNDSLLTEYKVKVYPTYYLINPDGKLSLDYTPSPEEEFEHTYNTVFKEWKQQQNSGIR